MRRGRGTVYWLQSQEGDAHPFEKGDFMGRAVPLDLYPGRGHNKILPQFFRSRPVGDVCLDIAKFAEDRDCRTLPYLMKLAATEAYECLDEPITPFVQAKSFGLWEWDVSTNLVYADETTAKLFGVDPVKSKQGLDLSHFEGSIYSDDVPKYASALHAAVQNGGVFEVRYRLISNGNLISIYAKGTCFLSGSKAPVRFPGALMEI